MIRGWLNSDALNRPVNIVQLDCRVGPRIIAYVQSRSLIEILLQTETCLERKTRWPILILWRVCLWSQLCWSLSLVGWPSGINSPTVVAGCCVRVITRWVIGMRTKVAAFKNAPRKTFLENAVVAAKIRIVFWEDTWLLRLVKHSVVIGHFRLYIGRWRLSVFLIRLRLRGRRRHFFALIKFIKSFGGLSLLIIIFTSLR